MIAEAQSLADKLEASRLSLREMERYAEAAETQCRRTFFDAWFNDDAATTSHCGWCDLCGYTSSTGQAEVLQVSPAGKELLMALTDTVQRVRLSTKIRDEKLEADLEGVLDSLAGSDAESIARTRTVRELQDTPTDPALRLVMADMEARSGDVAVGVDGLQRLVSARDHAPSVAAVAVRRLAVHDPKLAFASFLNLGMDAARSTAGARSLSRARGAQRRSRLCSRHGCSDSREISPHQPHRSRMSTETGRSLSNRLVQVADQLSAQADRLKQLPTDLDSAVAELRAEIAKGDEAQRIQRETQLAEVAARIGGAITEFREADRVEAERRAGELQRVAGELRDADRAEAQLRTVELAGVADELRKADGEEASARRLSHEELDADIHSLAQRTDRTISVLRGEFEEQQQRVSARMKMGVGAIVVSYVLGGASVFLATQG